MTNSSWLTHCEFVQFVLCVKCSLSFLIFENLFTMAPHPLHLRFAITCEALEWPFNADRLLFMARGMWLIFACVLFPFLSQ